MLSLNLGHGRGRSCPPPSQVGGGLRNLQQNNTGGVWDHTGNEFKPFLFARGKGVNNSYQVIPSQQCAQEERAEQLDSET